MSTYKTILVFTLIISFLFVFNASAQTETLNSETHSNEERYFEIWTYIGEGIPIPFSQTIAVSVGYDCDAYLSRIHVTRSFLNGSALMGVHMPFTERVFLDYIKWYIDGSLHKTISTFEYPSTIADPNHISKFGEDYSPFDIYLDSKWDQVGRIEVWTDQTLEMWQLYTVEN